MGSLPLRRDAAARWTRAAQVGIALAAGLVIVAFRLPAPEVEVEAARMEREAPAAAEEPARAHPTAHLGEQDYSELAADVEALHSPLIEQWRIDRQREEEARLAKLQEEESRAETEVAEGAPEPARTGGFAPPWKFLGAVREGDRMTALLVIDGRQVFAGPGYRRDGYEIASVSADRMRVLQGRSEHELRRESSERGRELETTTAAGSRGPVDIRNGGGRLSPARIDPDEDGR